MSAYLHYGMVSPMRIAREAAEINSAGIEKYLDELLIWRELAYAFCFHRADHDQWSALPEWAQVTLPSGEIRRIPASCRATIGTMGNSDHMNVVIGKAGRNRWKGIRPTVRGTAMNPIDHPHGGGEGRTKGGRHPVSPTGVPAKGGRTRKHGKPSNSAIVRRRKSRRYGQLKMK